MEDIPGSHPPRRRPQRQIIVRDAEGRGYPIRLPLSCTADWLRGALRERGLEQARLEEVICEPGTEADRLPAWVRTPLNEVFPGAKDIQWSLPDGGPQVNLDSPLLMGLGVRYFRALAKLAFHYFLHEVPWVDGRDPSFARVREFIDAGQGNPWDFVDPNAASFILRGVGDAPPDQGHCLLLEMESDVIVWMKLFSRSPYRRPCVKVSVGTNPSVLTRRHAIGHSLELFPKRRDGFDGRMKRVPVVRHEGRLGVYLP